MLNRNHHIKCETEYSLYDRQQKFLLGWHIDRELMDDLPPGVEEFICRQVEHAAKAAYNKAIENALGFGTVAIVSSSATTYGP